MTDHVTQAAELVERLRSTWPKSPDFGPITTAQRDTIHEAADLIERLSAELVAHSGGWEAAKEQAAQIARDAHNASGTGWTPHAIASAISSMEAPSHD